MYASGDIRTAAGDRKTRRRTGFGAYGIVLKGGPKVTPVRPLRRAWEMAAVAHSVWNKALRRGMETITRRIRLNPPSGH
jgi:hypothetical protein